jgi:hypothetical protein
MKSTNLRDPGIENMEYIKYNPKPIEGQERSLLGKGCMIEEFILNQRRNLEETKDPHLKKAITGGRREALTEEMNIVEKNSHIIGPTTTT